MKNKTQLLNHFQRNAKEAFRVGFTMRTGYECLGSEVYEVHKYYLPCHIAKKVRFLRNYFVALDEPNIPIDYKRRKHFCEFAETAVMILARFEHALRKGHSFLVGSQHVSALPWATCGTNYKDRLAQNFSQPIDIARFYLNYLHGNCYPIDLHFRSCPELVHRIARRFPAPSNPRSGKPPIHSPNFWMSIAITLAVDLIRNSGPDCMETFELFTNDYRENSENFNLKKWQELRCLVLGVKSLPGVVLPKPKLIVPSGPIKPRYTKAKTEIKEIAYNVALEEGEKTKPVFFPKAPPIPYADCPEAVGFDQMKSPWPEDIGIGVHGIKHVRHRYILGGTPDIM